MTAREAPGLVPHLQAHLAELWLGPNCWLDRSHACRLPRRVGMCGDPQAVPAAFWEWLDPRQ